MILFSIMSHPDQEVLLSDFGGWHFVLGGLVPISDSEEESDQLEAYLDTLTEEDQKAFLSENWERIFDIEPFENEWTHRGTDIQATFWELKKEYVQGVRFFTAGKRKC